MDGKLYVTFGGHFGDCGDYHGWVIGVPLDNPTSVIAWAARGRGGGIWAPGGISSDGRWLYVATGNTLGAETWSDGGAVFRLAPDLHRTDRKQDFFAASGWRRLDGEDADLGGTNPLPINVSGPTGTQTLLLALGISPRPTRSWWHRRRSRCSNRLDGRHPDLARRVSCSDGMFAVFEGQGADCPASTRRENLTVLHISTGSPSSLPTAWCGVVRGRGAPS